MKKQTAVEWLMPKILELNLQLSLRKISARNCELEIAKLFEQSNAIFKEQIELAYNDGRVNAGLKLNRTAQEYYTETYEK